MYKIPCSKCDGKGKLQEYSMLAGGTCFKCKGSGEFTVNEKQYNEYLEREEEKKQIKKMKVEYNQLLDRVKWLDKNISLILELKENEEYKTPDGEKVYNHYKNTVKEDLNNYKRYKATYKQEIKEIESICKKYSITCV